MKRYTPTPQTNMDSYKLGHADMYPEGTEFIQTNFTPRSSRFQTRLDGQDNKIVWVGMQDFLLELNHQFKTEFFSKPKNEVLEEMEKFNSAFAGPNGFNSSRWGKLHDLGYLPLKLFSLPEGSAVSPGVPVFTCINTLKDFYWLPNELETWLSCHLWIAATSATTARHYRQILNHYVKRTGSNPEFADWQLHDFSMRGMTSVQSAARSGLGHLLFSMGTDNLPAVKLINDVYSVEKSFVGGSVPATEHSIMCCGGRESEIETFRRLIKTYPSGVLSIVSDTWDFFSVVTNLASELKEEILARTPDSLGLAKVVFRPDSGDPMRIICGYQDHEVDKIDDDKFWVPAESKMIDGKEYLGAVRCLDEVFGHSKNSQGFKTLNQRVGLIYGDAITLERMDDILNRLCALGYAADNIVFGIGSYTYQYQTRDSNGFAMKATYCVINGKSLEIFKDPKTDSGTKKSAKGVVRVVKFGGEYQLEQGGVYDESFHNELKLVYKDGEILSKEEFSLMRERAMGTL